MPNHYFVDKRTGLHTETYNYYNPVFEGKTVAASSYTSYNATLASNPKATTTYANSNARTLRLRLVNASVSTQYNPYTFGSNVRVGLNKYEGGCDSAVAMTLEPTEYITLTANGDNWEYPSFLLSSAETGNYSYVFILNDELQLANGQSTPQRNPINIDTSNAETHCISTTGAELTDFDSSDFPIRFTSQALEGYYFETPPYIVYFDSIGQQVTANLVETSTGLYEYTLQTEVDQYINFHANAVVDTRINDLYGVITVYNPSIDDLRNISNSRYFYETDTAESRYYKDLGDFIVSLHKVYTTFTGLKTQKLMLANYNVTGSEVVPVIDFETKVLDCGTVEVIGKYGNVLDFESQLKLYLPFVGFENLDTEKYMDKTIHLYYKLDIITGKAKAFLEVDNAIIDTFDCELSYNVPWILADDISGKLNLNDGYLYGFVPFLQIYTPVAYGDNATYGNNTNKVGAIGEFTGYTRFSDTTLAVSATEIEKIEIDRLLKEGVIL